MKLKTKVNLFSTLLTLLILIGSFTGIYFLYKELAFSTEAEQLQARANELSTAVSSLTTTNSIDTIFRAYIPTDGAIIVRNEEEKNLIHLQMTSEQIEFEVDNDEPYTKKIIGHIPYIALTTPLIWPDQQIVEAKFIQPLPTITENLNQLIIILMLMTLLAIVPMYLASQLLVRLIVKPVQRLTTTMEKNIHDFSFEQLPVKKSSRDEIARMTTTYNHLMAQLEDVHDRQQQFVGNASHELKTPLTVIESYAKLLKRRGTTNVEVTEEALTAILNETNNMKTMIEQMLALAKVNETTKVTLTMLSLLPFVQTIADSFEAAYHRKIYVDVPDIKIKTDEAKLKQLLFIFIDNAQKYSEDVIEITAHTTNHLHITIRDYGIGIPKEDIPNLFNRFYRVDKDRNKKTGGVGIGLSIAKELANRMNAQISIESVLGSGTAIHIQLPLIGGELHES
jgi:two-component system, OmpR family, sensor histidine kinase ArlS